MNKEKIINLLLTKSIIFKVGKTKAKRRYIRKTTILELLQDYLFNNCKYIRFYHLVWNIYNPHNPIIKNSGYCIHHINGDKLDDRIDNLQKMLHSEHAKLHRLGKEKTQETKDKISKTRIKKGLAKGKNNPMYGTHRTGKDNPMYGVHRVGKDSPFYGKKHSKESKQKMSLSRKGKKLSIEHRKKLVLAHKKAKYKKKETDIYCMY